MSKLTTYTAFLRGINVGGHKIIKMEELREAFEELKFKNVRTLLASGNVIFQSEEKNLTILTQKIEQQLAKRFGHEIGVIIRSSEEIKSLINSDPFKGVVITPNTRLYITFLSEKSKNNLIVPYESPNKDYKVLRITDGEVFSVLTLLPDVNTTDLMKFLEKEFGKKITTRNLNTIAKIANATQLVV